MFWVGYETDEQSLLQVHDGAVPRVDGDDTVAVQASRLGKILRQERAAPRRPVNLDR